MSLRIATWNINSVRLRIERVAAFLREHAPEVLCLQETKVEDALFPVEAIAALGYSHCYFRGQKSYNGVAILSRVALGDVTSHELLRFNGERHIAATLPDGTRLHNFYIPAGGDIPDAALNQKFADKLEFLRRMTEYFTAQDTKQAILVGDFNIAPGEHDVWSHKQLLGVVSHTPVETAALRALQATRGFVDSAREFVPAAEKLYSWWSYRNRDWRASDRGRRLDHIWTTPDLRARLVATHTLKDLRDGEQPSDHVPVMLDVKRHA